MSSGSRVLAVSLNENIYILSIFVLPFIYSLSFIYPLFYSSFIIIYIFYIFTVVKKFS